MDERALIRLAPEHSDRFFRRLVLQATEYAIVLLGREGDITGWNEGAKRLFGWSVDEALGESGAILFTEEDRMAGSPEKELKTAFDKGYADGTRWHVRESGEHFWASAATEAVRDASGQLKGFAKIIRDRSNLKRYEEQLEQSVRDLDAFASHLAHEVRSPLSGVSMVLRMNRKRYASTLETDDLESLREAEHAVARVSRLTSDLLSFARLGAASDVKRQAVESREAVQNALRFLEDEIEGRGAEVETGELPAVYANPTLLRHLFRNLIANAIQNNTSEVPRAHVSAEEKAEKWIFRIEDNGVGIPEARHGQLFDLFKRDEQGRAESVGVGLALSKRIVERHGGRIWIESAPGKGSTFFFTLPK